MSYKTPRTNTMCPRSSCPFYSVTYYIKWVTTPWTHSIELFFKFHNKCTFFLHVIKIVSAFALACCANTPSITLNKEMWPVYLWLYGTLCLCSSKINKTYIWCISFPETWINLKLNQIWLILNNIFVFMIKQLHLVVYIYLFYTFLYLIISSGDGGG